MSGALAPTESSSTFSRFATGACAFTTALQAVMNIGILSMVASRLAALMPSCGDAWVSITTSSSGWPLMPPASFTSFAAMRMTVTKSAP